MAQPEPAGREKTPAELALAEMIKTLIRPIIEEMLTNTFDVYRTVHQHEERFVREIVRDEWNLAQSEWRKKELVQHGHPEMFDERMHERMQRVKREYENMASMKRAQQEAEERSRRTPLGDHLSELAKYRQDPTF